MADAKPFSLALVTGASSGIGEALCHLLAGKGVELIIAGRNKERLQQLAAQLQVKATIVPGDLSLPADRLRLIEKIREAKPDLVINNAGYGLYGEALSYETQTQMDILKVDIDAVVELSLEAARKMVSSKKEGVIVNISSAAAFQVFPCFAVYAASKAFVNHFSESLDEELRHYGIRVLASCPGMVATHFRARASGEEISPGSSSLVMTASFAANEIWGQIEKRKPIHVFNWKYRLGTWLTRYLIPKKWAIKIVRSNVEKRYTHRPIIE